jgi:hypothetical protein
MIGVRIGMFLYRGGDARTTRARFRFGSIDEASNSRCEGVIPTEDRTDIARSNITSHFTIASFVARRSRMPPALQISKAYSLSLIPATSARAGRRIAISRAGFRADRRGRRQQYRRQASFGTFGSSGGPPLCP